MIILLENLRKSIVVEKCLISWQNKIKNSGLENITGKKYLYRNNNKYKIPLKA